MPDTQDPTNPQLVAFCNNLVRKSADLVCGCNLQFTTLLGAYTTQGIAALIPNDPAWIVVDGSATDGRPPISGQRLLSFVALCEEFFAAAAALNSNETTVPNSTVAESISVNPQNYA